MFDFDKAVQDAQEELSVRELFALLLGPSGGGKSSLMGTFGEKTLLLYTTGEDHGPKAAAALGRDNVVPLCIDYYDGNVLIPDESIDLLYEVLDNHTWLQEQGFRAICIDGATQLELLFRGTTRWKKMCETKNGKHSGFEEPKATNVLFKEVVDKLKTAQRALNVHVAMTCVLDVKALGPHGEIQESAPKLTGYMVAEGLVQQFGDVLVVGRMEKKGKVKHKIQMLAGVTKTSSDADTGEIKKTINYSPRLTCVGLDDLPTLMNADLAEVYAIKQEKLSEADDVQDEAG